MSLFKQEDTEREPRITETVELIPTSEYYVKFEETFRNLLITEHVLRSQYIDLQHSRRQGLLFLLCILGTEAFFIYRLIYTQSKYFFVLLMERLLAIALGITVFLFFLTGMYTKTFRTAPQFLHDTNRGLKSLNFKLVKTRVSFWGKIIRIVYNPVYATDPSGPLKLTLNPSSFSLTYMEEWELFRDEYWIRQKRRQKRRKRGSKSKKAHSE